MGSRDNPGVYRYIFVCIAHTEHTRQNFITFMDALKLGFRAKDQLHPILQELVTGYARFKGSKDWEGRGKMVSW